MRTKEQRSKPSAMGRPKSLISRRLSKPRQEPPSPDVLSSFDTSVDLSSPLTTSDMEYFGEYATVTSSQGEKRSSGRSRSKIRAYLYGPSRDTSPSSSSDNDDERRNSLASAARGARRRLSRTGSSIMQLSSAKASTNYLSCASTSNLLSNPGPDESIRVANQIKERAHVDSLAAQNHVSHHRDEDACVHPVMAPVRRRSLYTPGIATRNASDILRKPPPPRTIETQADRDYYYNQAYPDSSPLAKLASLNFNNDGRSTPDSFRQIGGLELGTLRVINGTTSPAPDTTPDVFQHPLTSASNLSEKFLTASEGSEDESKLDDTETRRSESALSCATLSNLVRSSEEPEMSNCGFEHSRCAEIEFDLTSAMANDYMLELQGSPFGLPDLQALAEPGSIVDLQEDEGIFMQISDSNSEHAWKAIVNETQLDQNDHGGRAEAFAKLSGRTPTPADSLILADDSNTVARSSFAKAPRSDSGYSSNASLGASSKSKKERERKANRESESRPRRSTLRQRLTSGFRGASGPKIDGEGPMAPLQSPPSRNLSFKAVPWDSLPDTGAQPRIGTIKETREPAQGLPNVDMPKSAVANWSEESQARKLQKSRPKSQTPPTETIIVQGYCDISYAHIPRVPSLMVARHAERLTHFPLLERTFPSSNHVNPSQSPLLGKASIAPIRFPSPANALEAAAGESPVPIRASTGGILEAGQGASSSSTYERGVGQDLTLTNSDDRNDTKLQKRAIKEQKENKKRLIREEKELEKRLSRDRKQLEKQKRKHGSRERSRSRPSSWFRGRSSERDVADDDDGAFAVIADLGTVTESLGGSPYDIARRTQQRSPSKQSPVRHPHQISTVGQFDKPSGASHGGADCHISSSSLGTQLTRSTDSQIRIEPTRGRIRSRSFAGPRDESSTVGTLKDPGDFLGKSLRPRTMTADIPPVPALPSSHRVREREQQKAEARPKSAFVEIPNSMGDDQPMNTSLEPHTHETIPKVSRQETCSRSAVPSLWRGGSIEDKGTRDRAQDEVDASDQSSTYHGEIAQANAVEDMWETSRQAWRQRRKSAGEALSRKSSFELRKRASRVDFVEDIRPAANTEFSNTAPSPLPTPSERRAQLHATDSPRRRVSSGRANTQPVLSSYHPFSGHPSEFEGGFLYGVPVAACQ